MVDLVKLPAGTNWCQGTRSLSLAYHILSDLWSCEVQMIVLPSTRARIKRRILQEVLSKEGYQMVTKKKATLERKKKQLLDGTAQNEKDGIKGRGKETEPGVGRAGVWRFISKGCSGGRADGRLRPDWASLLLESINRGSQQMWGTWRGNEVGGLGGLGTSWLFFFSCEQAGGALCDALIGVCTKLCAPSLSV